MVKANHHFYIFIHLLIVVVWKFQTLLLILRYVMHVVDCRHPVLPYNPTTNPFHSAVLFDCDLVSVYFWPPVTTIISLTSMGFDVLDSTKENVLWCHMASHRGRHRKKIPHIVLIFISSF